jgi:hypothetical protein
MYSVTGSAYEIQVVMEPFPAGGCQIRSGRFIRCRRHDYYRSATKDISGHSGLAIILCGHPERLVWRMGAGIVRQHSFHRGGY